MVIVEKEYEGLVDAYEKAGGDRNALLTKDIARIVAFETSVRIGPAAAVAVGGFFCGLKNKQIDKGEVVLINIGEGIRRDPDFMNSLLKGTTRIANYNECHFFNRHEYKTYIWSKIKERFCPS